MTANTQINGCDWTPRAALRSQYEPVGDALCQRAERSVVAVDALLAQVCRYRRNGLLGDGLAARAETSAADLGRWIHGNCCSVLVI